VKFTTEFHMTNDSHLFVTRDKLEQMGAVEISGHRWILSGTTLPDKGSLEIIGYDELRQMAEREEIELFLPLWEGKKCWFYDYEFETTQFWINLTGGLSKLNEGSQGWDIDYWRTGFRRIAASTNERTLVLCFAPSHAFCSYGIIFPTYSSMSGVTTTLNEIERACLSAIIGSFVLDFILRFSVTTSVAIFNGENLPVPRLNSESKAVQFIVPRVMRLICTSDYFANVWRSIFMTIPFPPDLWCPTGEIGFYSYGPKHEQDIRHRLAEEAANLTPEWSPACGVHDRTPNRRDTGDRAQLRAEIDAYVAHLYGLTRDEFAYILDTFPVLKRKEEQAFGEFMSKRKCLEEYDRVATIL